MPLRIVQINLHHSSAATPLLVAHMAEFNLDVALIQEPWIVQGLPRGLGMAGHSGHAGNELADTLANHGSSYLPIGTEPSLPISSAIFVRGLKSWCHQLHLERWRSRTDCRMAKELLVTSGREQIAI